MTEPFVTWSLLILTFFLNSSFCFQLSFSPLSPFRYFIFVFSYLPFFCFFPSLYSHLFWVFFLYYRKALFFIGFLFRPLFLSLRFSFLLLFTTVFFCSLQWTASLVQNFLLLLFVTVWYYPLFYQHLFLRFWTGIAQEKEERGELRKLESCRFKVFEPHKINSGTHI